MLIKFAQTADISMN